MPEFDETDTPSWEDTEPFLTLAEAGLENGFEDDTVPGECFNYYFKSEA